MKTYFFFTYIDTFVRRYIIVTKECFHGIVIEIEKE